MNPLAAQMAAFRQQAQDQEDALNPCRIRVNSGPWIPAASATIQADELSLAIGGVQEVSNRAFRIRKSLLPSRPAEAKTQIEEEGGKIYRVKTVSGDKETSPAWLVTCEAYAK
jgi:hypothetical protein